MSSTEPDIFVYKLVADHNGAPCVSGELLSLAICKPKIRSKASPGAFVFGFGGKDYDERLIYIAQVTVKLAGGSYYTTREYARRPDCIYRNEDGKAVRKTSAKYHADSDHRKKDVGLRFENADVLLSSDFRYLGNKGTNAYKERYPRVRRLIENLKQGHRRYHSDALRKELMALKEEVWKAYRRRKVGAPSDSDVTKACDGVLASASC